MNKLTLLFLAVIAFACNNENTTSKDTIKDSAKAATTSATAINYPYTIEQPDNWNIGSTANTLVALSALKAWEEGKMDESMKYFGDSVWLQFDALDKKMPNDSLKAILSGGRNSFKSITIKMDDWLSVISKDKQTEWVTLWYTQYWETKKGIKDSSETINDLQVKDGKIIRLDEYTRKLH